MAIEAWIVKSRWIDELRMLDPAHFRNFLFDFDGTLIDSAPLHAEAFYDVVREERPTLISGFSYEPLKGLMTSDAFRRLGIADEAEVRRLSAKKQTRYRNLVHRGRLSLLPGARELLREGANEGYRLFLVTSGSGPTVRTALAALNLLDVFEDVVSADDVKMGKPFPDPFLLCLQRNGLTKSESIVIEDAESGVIAARAANLSVAGVNNRGVESIVDCFFSDLTKLHATIANKNSVAL
ncbi:HAD-IA family hydrolase [Bradyrhizobium sp. CSA207]|uniref:HAD family hydrolase n=1 Tax=Bradyrhizobium sp. CSA207 TaxID=2698826 RepID=UPI0023B1A5E9|nr:HAD family hydrolase [Bradyrhizobium sp. CSA207]MDE5446824.1 HAD-IA family hydrolase [Bradyrhizobium sp. CSA207]